MMSYLQSMHARSSAWVPQTDKGAIDHLAPNGNAGAPGPSVSVYIMWCANLPKGEVCHKIGELPPNAGSVSSRKRHRLGVALGASPNGLWGAGVEQLLRPQVGG